MGERKIGEAKIGEGKRAGGGAGRLNVSNLLTLIGVVALVGTEVIGVALAAGWAIAGLFQLGDQVGYALMTVLAGLGLYAMVLFVRRALRIEPIWG